MSEGGLLAWKIQNVKSNGPIGDYSKLSIPLPEPPSGYTWEKGDENREWTLHRINDAKNTQDAAEEEWEMISTTSSVKTESSTSSVTDGVCNANPKIRKFGVDHTEHIVLPTDTLPGLCLAYKTTATKIRQLNHFSGNTLMHAPPKLIISLSGNYSGKIRTQDTTSQEFKMHAFLSEFGSRGLRNLEAKTYLELTENNLEEAIHMAREDLEWEISEEAKTCYGTGWNSKPKRLELCEGVPSNLEIVASSTS